MIEKNKNTCKNCRHFYVTYTQNYPWGCKAFGFKSKKYPYLEVYSNSGMKCALFKSNLLDRQNLGKNKGRFA
tara:strand:- start:210 stop:425 length:216 start_codon:yes stop_codon:yes gene_type:complete